MNTFDGIIEGINTAFIDKDHISDYNYRPQFVSNNYKEGRKVLSSLEEELLDCDSFVISVAFITMSGITPLLQTLKQLEERNIKGKILTTDYLSFSEPKALDKLNSLKNIELKMFSTEKSESGFHTKGYIFKKEGIYRAIVGSSNMTSAALMTNHEWNTRIISTESGEYIESIINEFNTLWDSEYSFDYEEIKDFYKTKYDLVKEQKKLAEANLVDNTVIYSLEPNSMQVEFIKNLRLLWAAGEKRALLISATGTGKTYASAFAMREFKPRKALFIVHREQIAKQAMKSYLHVIGTIDKDGYEIKYGLLSGNQKDYDSDYLFATMQTLSKEDILNSFSPTEFDFICIDESHKAGAESYKKIISYFKPKFLLGMTATPERTDGIDIYKLFNHKIAYEIRLQKALEANLLCPFHYFGITEKSDISDDTVSLDNATSDDRIDYIIEQLNYYSYSGDRVHGLVFNRSLEEAEKMSSKFNERGFKTIALSGGNSIDERLNAIELLCKDIGNDYSIEHYDYVFTVDIFNEGVDIPEVNQIVLLRPTISPIIFCQQLGRGLRKYTDKEYTVILDFIGNYNNNFMIPLALSGDRSYNRDSIRRYVQQGNKVVPGLSTIHFDEISKEKIYKSINRINPNKYLKDKYFDLKYRLGHIPSFMDFYKYGEVDPELFLSGIRKGKRNTYNQFVKNVDSDYTVEFTDKEEKVISFISQSIVKGQRLHELLLIRELIHFECINASRFAKLLESFGVPFKDEDFKSAINYIRMNFFITDNKKKFGDLVLVDADGKISDEFKCLLDNKKFVNEVETLIDYGIRKFMDVYNSNDAPFQLYEKYDRSDVCHLLNWEKDEYNTVNGYRVKYNSCPIFVTYDKSEGITLTTQYDDKFINPLVFSWMSRSNVTLNNREVSDIIHADEKGISLHLFVKKNDDEGKEFYYLGKVKPLSSNQDYILDANGNRLPIVNIMFSLNKSVRNDMYHYFVDGIKNN